MASHHKDEENTESETDESIKNRQAYLGPPSTQPSYDDEDKVEAQPVVVDTAQRPIQENKCKPVKGDTVSFIRKGLANKRVSKMQTFKKQHAASKQKTTVGKQTTVNPGQGKTPDDALLVASSSSNGSEEEPATPKRANIANRAAAVEVTPNKRMKSPPKLLLLAVQYKTTSTNQAPGCKYRLASNTYVVPFGFREDKTGLVNVKTGDPNQYFTASSPYLEMCSNTIRIPFRQPTSDLRSLAVFPKAEMTRCYNVVMDNPEQVESIQLSRMVQHDEREWRCPRTNLRLKEEKEK